MRERSLLANIVRIIELVNVCVESCKLSIGGFKIFLTDCMTAILKVLVVIHFLKF